MAGRAAIDDHIKAFGPEKFERLYALAMYQIRQDRHFVGMNRIREAMATEAALRASGFPPTPFVAGTKDKPASQEVQDICDGLLEVAVKSASESLVPA